MRGCDSAAQVIHHSLAHTQLAGSAPARSHADGRFPRWQIKNTVG